MTAIGGNGGGPPPYRGGNGGLGKPSDDLNVKQSQDLSTRVTTGKPGDSSKVPTLTLPKGKKPKTGFVKKITSPRSPKSVASPPNIGSVSPIGYGVEQAQQTIFILHALSQQGRGFTDHQKAMLEDCFKVAFEAHPELLSAELATVVGFLGKDRLLQIYQAACNTQNQPVVDFFHMYLPQVLQPQVLQTLVSPPPPVVQHIDYQAYFNALQGVSEPIIVSPPSTAQPILVNPLRALLGKPKITMVDLQGLTPQQVTDHLSDLIFALYKEGTIVQPEIIDLMTALKQNNMLVLNAWESDNYQAFISFLGFLCSGGSYTSLLAYVGPNSYMVLNSSKKYPVLGAVVQRALEDHFFEVIVGNFKQAQSHSETGVGILRNALPILKILPQRILEKHFKACLDQENVEAAEFYLNEDLIKPFVSTTDDSD